MPNSEASNARGPWSAATTVWGAALIAAFSTMNLLYWDPKQAVPAAIPAIALLAVFAALHDGTGWRSFVPQVRLHEEIAPISVRVVTLLLVALGIRIFVLGQREANIFSTAVLGIAKALSWYTMAKAVCGPVVPENNP